MSLTGACESWEAGKALGADWTTLADAYCAADWESAPNATTGELACVLRRRSRCCTAAAGLRACKFTKECSFWLINHGRGAAPSTKRSTPSTSQIQSSYTVYALEARHHAAHGAIILQAVRLLSVSTRNAYRCAYFPRNKLKSSYSANDVVSQLFHRLTHPSLRLSPYC